MYESIHLVFCTYHSDCSAVAVNVETHELVVDAARCIASAEDSTNHTEVFVSPE